MSRASIEPAVAGSGEMFDRIAGRYDLLNRILSLGVDRRWRRRAVQWLALGPSARVLDLATGTGDLAIEIARTHRDARVVGLDPSREMLAVGERKIARRGLGDRVELTRGRAEQLPFEARSVDGVTIAFGIRNVPDRAAALREMARVTRVGGRVVVLELSEPGGGLLGRLAKFHVHVVVPWLGALLSGRREYRYLQRSIEAFPDARTFGDLMRANGLDVLDIVPLTFGVAHLYVATPRSNG